MKRMLGLKPKPVYRGEQHKCVVIAAGVSTIEGETDRYRDRYRDGWTDRDTNR